jgi:hypothetical protein
MEVEKLKLLLFDDDQRALFEHMPKPILFDKEVFSKTKHKDGKKKILMTNGATFWQSENKDSFE